MNLPKRQPKVWWIVDVGQMAKAPRAPKPPDYSTPEAVTARCRERGTGTPWDRKVWGLLSGDGRLYRDYRAACARARERMATWTEGGR